MDVAKENFLITLCHSYKDNGYWTILEFLLLAYIENLVVHFYIQMTFAII